MAREPEHYSIDRDRFEAVTRVVAAIIVAIVVWVSHAATLQGPPLQHTLIQYGVLVYALGALAICADMWLRPSSSASRNLLGISLDVAGVSAGLYLGAGTVDPVALFYLWIMLGSGMVYGMRYLFIAGAMSILGFGFVYSVSEYWQNQPQFSATIAGLMILLGPYMALLLHSLEKTRREVSWQANHDSLTRLLNRRAFEQMLHSILNADDTEQTHFLLYLDLDRFKDINDSAGHAAGDRALVDITRILRSNIRENDVIARMGGDEFCILMPALTLEQARRRSERIRNEVASYRLAWGTQIYTLGVSIGAACSASAADAGALIRLADAACYAAKNNGRNQVHVVDTLNEVADTQMIRKLVLPENTQNARPRPAKQMA